jgi:phage gpG-like protein
LPYAVIHNEGGLLTVTDKMKSFFWAMYYKSSGAAKGQKNSRGKALSLEAGLWKAMALKKVGSRIKIDARPFIGPHPQVDNAVERVFDDTMKEFEQFIHQTLEK